MKITTEWDDRDGEWNFVNKAEFFNTPDSLIKIFYTISHRDEAYTYDDNNNRVSEEVTLRGTTSRVYRYYPNTDKLLTDGRYAYQYDGEGNLTAKGTYLETSDGTQVISDLTASFWSTVEGSTDGITIASEHEWWSYEYDAFNRLINVNKNGEEVAEYTYNAANLRVETIKPDATTYYAFSLHGKLLYEDDGTTERVHTYATGRHFAVDETEGSDTTRYFTHTDHLGSVTAVTDSDGTLVWNNEYLPFGDEAKTTNSRFAMFTGKQKDVDTGLFYYNARWYDASLGRFVSQDPIRSGVNWYAYANVNPLKYTDPTGLDTKGIKFALNAGLIGGVSTDIKLSIDDDGNLGLSVSLAAGVSTPDLSATVSGTVSNADDIYSSAGEGVTTAATFGEGIIGTVEESYIPQDDGIAMETAVGVGVSVPGLPPAGGSSMVSYSVVGGISLEKLMAAVETITYNSLDYLTGMKELDQILEGVENPFGFDDGVNELGAAKKEEENQERENDNSGNDGTRKENIENNHDEEPDNIKYDGKGNVSGL